MFKDRFISNLLPFLESNSPVILLDTAFSDSISHNSYLFVNPVEILSTKKFNEVEKVLGQIDELCKKYWIAGFLSYEAAYGMQEKLSHLIPAGGKTNQPLCWFGVFKKPFVYDHRSEQWLSSPFDKKVIEKRRVSDNVITIQSNIDLKTSISFAYFSRKISKIKYWIKQGHTYQVNFTFDVGLTTDLPTLLLYKLLRDRQKTAFCSFINTGEEQVLSFSPELFFRKKGARIYTKPMKGTAPRGADRREDNDIRRNLKSDIKNRSENIMIVDLLRNDLGRVCRTGSVSVNRLFEIEKHKTLFQMTSTIKGRLNDPGSYKKLFLEIFPSGSVTGAPKIRTMEIIHKLEEGTRGVYCGAIGFISPFGESVFSVPIRTLQKKHNHKYFKYRVGSGIVWDSKARCEWDECRTKCGFLTVPEANDFEIFESILWNKRFKYFRAHILRFKKSASYFGYPLDKLKLDKIHSEIRSKLRGKSGIKVRIFLNRHGDLRWDFSLLPPPDSGSKKVILSKAGLDKDNFYLFHKTTYRPWYDDAVKEIKNGKIFDKIFFNNNGELTEGAISNIFIKINNILYTPPVKCGLLPGILRQNLLINGKCRERILYKDDLTLAQSIYCGNSVRGLVEVRLFKNKELPKSN
ncbi:MAG: aminodeoxychorismate synthase component I [bacterium]